MKIVFNSRITEGVLFHKYVEHLMWDTNIPQDLFNKIPDTARIEVNPGLTVGKEFLLHSKNCIPFNYRYLNDFFEDCDDVKDLEYVKVIFLSDSLELVKSKRNGVIKIANVTSKIEIVYRIDEDDNILSSIDNSEWMIELVEHHVKRHRVIVEKQEAIKS